MSDNAVWVFATQAGDTGFSIVPMDPAALIGSAPWNALRTATQGCSVASLAREAQFSELAVSGAPAPGAGAWQAADRVVFRWLCADGTTYITSIPAPLAAILDSNDRVIRSHASIVALIAAMVGTAQSESGIAIVALIDGHRERRVVLG